MNGSQSELSVLRDARLAVHATSPLPVWLWSGDGRRIVWANPVGDAMLGAASVAAVGSREFESGHPAAGQVARLAATLASNGPPRLERLRGFGAELGRALTCSCSHVTLHDGSAAILIVANESAGPSLSLSERVHRLLAGSDKAVAAYSATGQLLCATQSAHAHVGGATSLAALGAQDLALTALANGHADGSVGDHQVSVDRVGSGSATVLIAHFAQSKSEGERKRESEILTVAPAVPEQTEPAKPFQDDLPVARVHPPRADPESFSAPRFLSSEEALVRRHPLRFVWQLNEQGRFSIDSDEFLAVAGERTASAVGRRWEDIASELDLDRDGQIARAIATRDTWSGLTVNWPIHGEQETLCVELSGLPVFDRERIFRGYRGFGVCRDLARLSVLAKRRSAGARGSRPAVLSTGTGKNIVHLSSHSADTAGPVLTPVEHMAFRELSRKLTQGLAAAVEHEGKIALNPLRGLTGSEPARRQDIDAPGEPGASVPHSLLEQLPVGILVYRLNQLLYANPAFLRLTGYATIDQLTAEGGLDGLFIEPLGATGAQTDQHLRLTVRRDEQVTLDGGLIAIDWEGEPAHAVVLAHGDDNGLGPPAEPDTAELKAILDAAGDGIVLIDAQGMILFASRNAQALFGYELHQLHGSVFTGLLAPEHADVAHEQLGEVIRGGPGTKRGREVMGRTRQGSSVALFMTIAPVSNRPDRFCATFSDMRQWKQAEEELVRARLRAENASAAKSDFLAKISHEIRTPLNSIIGFSEVMIAEQFGHIENERYREYLKDIHASGQHLLSLVNDLLDLSKIEAGKLELNFSSVALNDLIQQCVAAMQPQSRSGQILIRTSLAPDLPRVVADDRATRQILLNVLSNSLKFTHAGGQIIISTAMNGDREVVVHVRDTGIGMTEQEVATALQPFRQVSTSSAGGAGLGLPLTKALAEANRAKFRLTSAPKEGTLVEIVFPASSVLSGSP